MKNLISQLAIYVVLFSGLFTSCADDDTTPGTTTTYVATISTMSTSASESDPGTGFTIELDKVNNEGVALAISYVISGTATSGSDFQGNTFTEIADGDQNVDVQLPIIDDSEVEGDETIIITLQTGTMIELGSASSVTITLSDNDSDGSGSCPNDNSTNQDNHNCDETPHTTNSYSEDLASDPNKIIITTNGIPTHDFRNQIPDQVTQLNSSTKTYSITKSPAVAGSITNIVDADYNPAYDFGLAKSGVPIDPAPGMPFIFENTQTGEFNWDWVMEPNNNMEVVGLDCAIAHVQPDGTYHYHGDMGVYADQLSSGISGGTMPGSAVQIGWAADGFPVIYKFGPDASGNLTELSPSYQVKAGDRPGDGVSEPCDAYNGKYTNDYEFVSGLGDLDQCNGIARDVTIASTTYGYFYVITTSFPVIPRCISGTPDNSFKKGN